MNDFVAPFRRGIRLPGKRLFGTMPVMISFSTLTSAAQASSYHDDHLSRGDYYDDKERAASAWFGIGADSLGLSGKCTKEDFENLCTNRRPDGRKLTARDDAERRVAFDFTLAPQKSVSIVALVGGDDRVREAHRTAVAAAMKELESFSAVRIRTGVEIGKDRITGNVIGVAFEHETSRAAGNGITPDPQLHTHLVIFNATKDGSDWKALQNFEMLRARSLVNTVYEHRLCQELKSIGYATRETGPKTWELSSISDKEVSHFSKRHNAIQKAVDAEAEKNGVGNRKALAAEIAQDNRIRKQPEATADALRADWKAQISTLRETDSLALENETATEKTDISAKEAVEFAKAKIFERAAVVRDVDVMAETFRRARGSSASIEELKAAVMGDTKILRSIDGRQVTTAGVLENESRVVDLVRLGRDKFAQLAPGGLIGERADKLTPRQRPAAEIVIGSKDFVTLFRGGAGTGKSFTLASIKESIEAGGGTVEVIAPQNKQVLALQRDGFTEAQTLAAFLGRKESPGKGAILIVDEAGQIAGADMRKLLESASANGNRVILAGDTRQHGAVAASDALIAIERFAQTRTAELAADRETIQRQKTDWHKEAVALSDKGQVVKAFDVLEENGAVRESRDALKSAAFSSIEAGRDGKSVLVISQTNVAVNRLNMEVRQELKWNGKIQGEREMMGLRGVDATKAEMRQAGTYAAGAMLIAHSKGDEFKSGEILQFVREYRSGIVAKDGTGKELKVSARNLEKFQLVREEKIAVGIGDKIQLRANVRLSENIRDKLANGQIFEVSGIGRNGELTIKSDGQEIQLPENFRQFSHGYAVTSYGSQGATVDKVIVADSGSQGATNKKEFYVSISRGREGVEIHTCDKSALRERIEAAGTRGLALDIAVRPAKQLIFQNQIGSRIVRGMAAGKKAVARVGEKIKSEIEKISVSTLKAIARVGAKTMNTKNVIVRRVMPVRSAAPPPSVGPISAKAKQPGQSISVRAAAAVITKSASQGISL